VMLAIQADEQPGLSENERTRSDKRIGIGEVESAGEKRL